MNSDLSSRRVDCRTPVGIPRKMQCVLRISGFAAMSLKSQGLCRALSSSSRPCSIVAAFQTDQSVEASAPMIRTVPYDVLYENRVYFSGRLGADFELLPSTYGYIAKAPLYVKSSKQGKDTLYKIELYEALAQAASSTVAKGDYIRVAGRLRCDEIVDKTNAKRLDVVVEADEVALVDNNMPLQQSEALYQMQIGQQNQQQPSWVQPQQVQSAVQSAWEQGDKPARPPFARLSPEEERELWAELERDRSQFWDNRENKRNPKAPDYKQKSTGHGLWLNSRNAPYWAAEELRQLSQ
ncbi:hypothetical protein CEUSTIGMA_g12601.t1 [Chlamydomonas eustigma]|uniref:Single-stranded DNA-binding protein n=1 Tax=Chlamydomonas eustigma TaxID=1157962 RepID=A0A250XQ85_9CHLO|nr:hypothetical protein CEUSTIGMA_g12601.t1 [Chlamydomonas eustigma]|eukprot:GAX85183.1 hypothetical protein CEUSTIGMA_g12601.t1 [Chlamydomonas eustigma]